MSVLSSRYILFLGDNKIQTDAAQSQCFFQEKTQILQIRKTNLGLSIMLQKKKKLQQTDVDLIPTTDSWLKPC